MLRKVQKGHSQRDQNQNQKSPRWKMSDLSKHMVFTVWITHFAALGVLWDTNKITLLFGHCFFSTFSIFEKVGARMVPKMDGYSMQKIYQIQPCHQKAPMRPQGEPRIYQMTPKRSRRGTKMMAQGTYFLVLGLQRWLLALL